jgi:alkylated DNA repair dioxygenase AlkB
MRRRFLGEGAWLDTAPAAFSGAAALFEELLERAPWAAHDRPMYDRIVPEPRLTTRRWDDPPAIVQRLGAALGERYGLPLDVVSANLYRDGDDSVAWHGDRIGRKRAETVVAILSLGAARRFLLRPKGGGASIRLLPAPGDLLVMGGTCQRTWEHCVPKCSFSGPRVSVMFREGY